MFKKYITIILFVSLFFVSSDAMTQGNPTPCPDGGAPPCGGPRPPGVPIDGGVIFLLAAGVAFGIKKLTDE